MRTFVKPFYDVMRLKEMTAMTQHYWGQIPGSILPARDKTSQQGVVAFFLTEAKEVLHSSLAEKLMPHSSGTVKVQS